VDPTLLPRQLALLLAWALGLAAGGGARDERRHECVEGVI
jgi:hypothetical protein